MDYKKLLEQIKDYLSNCEQMRYGEMVGAPWPYNHDGPMVYTEPDAVLLDLAYTAITDLLSRAEAAEERAEKAERERDFIIRDFTQYAKGGYEICAYCVHDNECEFGESLCIGTGQKGFVYQCKEE